MTQALRHDVRPANQLRKMPFDGSLLWWPGSMSSTYIKHHSACLANPWTRKNTHQQRMTGRLPGSPHRGQNGPAQRA